MNFIDVITQINKMKTLYQNMVEKITYGDRKVNIFKSLVKLISKNTKFLIYFETIKTLIDMLKKNKYRFKIKIIKKIIKKINLLPVYISNICNSLTIV